MSVQGTTETVTLILRQAETGRKPTLALPSRSAILSPGVLRGRDYELGSD
jgi:hypothetical protein